MWPEEECAEVGEARLGRVFKVRREVREVEHGQNISLIGRESMTFTTTCLQMRVVSKALMKF